MTGAMRKIRREKKGGSKFSAAPVSVLVHPSQFPAAVRRDLLTSLRTRRINHKFHYESFKQTQKWLALHEAYSPARADENCLDTYEKSFVETIARLKSRLVHLIGLGCGGGQKDAQLLRLLKGDGSKVFYTPSDVSVPVVLVAQQTVASLLDAKNIFPSVCDLTQLKTNERFFNRNETTDCSRLITFFGMLPNFEPQIILPKLAGLLRADDHLLLSANLAPGRNYQKGVEKILPLYDNELTRDWLQAFLWDLGLKPADGRLWFSIQDFQVSRVKVKCVAADFVFLRRCRITLPEEQFEFRRGLSLRLLYSFRHTPEQVEKLLAVHGVRVVDRWITFSGEEGVFLCRKIR